MESTNVPTRRPPLSSKLNICKSLKWTKHFEPRNDERPSSRPSLRVVHPYPDLLTVIYLCKDSYNDLPNEEFIPNPYKRLWSVRTSSDKGGYFGAIYLNESAKQLVLVHRGTNSFAAFKADVAIFSNTISRQMRSAMTCTHQLKSKMEKQFPKWKLIIAGHSLGSYLTDVSVFSHMYLEPNRRGTKFHKQNGIENPGSVTILPYGIGIDGPGSFDIISNLRDMTDVRYRNGERMRIEDLPIDHYVGVPNLINSHRQQVGGLFQIPLASNDKKNIPLLGGVLKSLGDLTGKVSTHFLDNFISAFTGIDPPSLNVINDFPKTQSERASINLHSESNSRTPRVADDMYAVERYQVAVISSGTTELRFFCSYVQKLLYDFDKVKLYAKQLTLLLENVSADDREFIHSVLTALQLDERNTQVVCSADGINKQKLIPWINEFFLSYPHFIDKETVICSMCRYIFSCQTPLQFTRDPFNMDLDSKLPYTIEAENTSIAANEVVATLEHLDKTYLLLKASQIELLEKIFHFDGDSLNYAVVVVEQDNEYDTGNFMRSFSLSKIIIIKYADGAPFVRCKVDDLTDKCKKDLLATELCLQGKTVKLHDFVVSAKISDALFHSLLRGSLNDIPKCIDIDSSNAYVNIERRLKELKDKPGEYATTFTVREAMERSKILIISDLPGAGKTTMATKLSLRLNDWVIKVNLNEKSAVLAKWHKTRRNIASSTPEDLLSELAGIDQLLKALLQSVIEDKKSVVKICVICDAFDEVKADYAELVIEFLKRLACERKIGNIIVTTRPHLRDKLETSLQTKLSLSSQSSPKELIVLHREGKLESALKTRSCSLDRFSCDELIEFETESKSRSLIRLLHDELIELHVKRQLERTVKRIARSHETLTKLHGKIKQSLQTEWSPLSTFSMVHEEIIDLHFNGKTCLHPQSSESRLLEDFLHEKVFKYLRDRIEKYLQNESCPHLRFTCSAMIGGIEDLETQSLDEKLSLLVEFSYENLLKLLINDKLEADVATNSYSLDTFSHEEGVEFMTKLIAQPSYDKERVERMFDQFAWSIDNDVRQTPMMLQLIASKLPDLNEDAAHTLSVHSLYSDHIKQVFRQYVEVKAGAQNNSAISEEMQEILFSTNLNFLYYFAVKELLHMPDRGIESYGLRQPCSDAERDRILRHGLLVGTDSSFRFKHRTYAEFFLAKWLMSDCSKPQAHKIFVDVISNVRVAGNNILVFLEGEADERRNTTERILESEKHFFEQMAELGILPPKRRKMTRYYHHRNEILSSSREKLSRYIFDGIKKFCNKNTLQKVLLNESKMLFETDTMDNFNFAMAMYHEAGLTSQSVDQPNCGMHQILKSSVERIANYGGDNEQYLFALFKLCEEYLDDDGIMKLIEGLNKRNFNTHFGMPRDLLIKTLKWQIQLLRTLNRENELKKAILHVQDKDIMSHSIFYVFPDIVHQCLKEMNSPVLDDLPKFFEPILPGRSSLWECLTSNYPHKFDIVSMRYVCLVIFPDQYGDHAANEYKLQFLDRECKKLKFILSEVANSSFHRYEDVAGIMLEMAMMSGICDEDVEIVLDVICHCARDTKRLCDLLFTFAALGSANAMKKLLNGVVIESNSDIIRIYTVDINERDLDGRTALQIAEMCDGNKHKLVVDVIKQHIRDRDDHGQDYNPWTIIKRNSAQS